MKKLIGNADGVLDEYRRKWNEDDTRTQVPAFLSGVRDVLFSDAGRTRAAATRRPISELVSCRRDRLPQPLRELVVGAWRAPVETFEGVEIALVGASPLLDGNTGHRIL